jgi:hypothetical protein
MCVENKRSTQLAQSQSVPARLYIGGQASRIRSGSIQIAMSVYDVISYFDYIYAWAYLTGPRDTKLMGLTTRIVDSG